VGITVCVAFSGCAGWAAADCVCGVGPEALEALMGL